MKRLPTLLELIVLALVFMAPGAPFTQMASATNWYVAINGTGSGTNWAEATNSIQGAIDAAAAGDTVWVSNGVYEAGGITNYPAGTVLTNRVAIYKAIIVQAFSTNPADTLIKGRWHEGYPGGPTTNKLGTNAVRCVYMVNGSSLIGFTLTNGATLITTTAGGDGGGVYCQSTNTVISNCVITGNAANRQGGGTYKGTLFNCTLTGNSAVTGGGGVDYGTLYNCTLTRNSSPQGGGVRGGYLYNCTLISNSAPNGWGGGANGGNLYNCTLTGNSAPSRSLP